MNKVSVIIPMYNSEKYIERCIDSIISQTYLNIEIIIINDGSIDNTRNICEKYMKADSRIKLYNTDNHGVSHARNYGLQFATGDYILFIDADDWIEKDTVEIMINTAINKNVEVVKVNYFNNFICKEVKNKVDNVIKENCGNKLSNDKKEYIVKYLFESSYYLNVIWGQLIKKSIITDIIFENNITYGEDTLFNFKLLMKAENIFFIEDAYYHYMINKNGINQNYRANVLIKKINNLNYIYKIISSEYENKEKISYKYLKEIVDNLLRISMSDANIKKVLEEEVNNIFFQECCNNINFRKFNGKYKMLIKLLKNENTNLFIWYSKNIFKMGLNIKNKLKGGKSG